MHPTLSQFLESTVLHIPYFLHRSSFCLQPFILEVCVMAQSAVFLISPETAMSQSPPSTLKDKKTRPSLPCALIYAIYPLLRYAATERLSAAKGRTAAVESNL